MGTCLILLSSTVTVDHIPHVFWKHSLLLYDVQCPVSYIRLNLPLGYQWNDLQIVEKVSATSGPIAAKELSILFIYRGYVRVVRWFVCSPLLTWEEFDDTKGVINIRKSQKNRQHELPSLYWIATLNRCPCIQRYIVGDGKCSTKLLSKLLTSIHSCSCQDGYSTT
jgi:hypothetical protein